MKRRTQIDLILLVELPQCHILEPPEMNLPAPVHDDIESLNEFEPALTAPNPASDAKSGSTC